MGFKRILENVIGLTMIGKPTIISMGIYIITRADIWFWELILVQHIRLM